MGEILKAAGCDYGNGKCCCDGCKQVILFIRIEKKNEVTLKKNKTKQPKTHQNSLFSKHSVVINSWKKQKESWIWIKK